MVGYRNLKKSLHRCWTEFIRHSDGGVSERFQLCCIGTAGVYQAFRWWGIGTEDLAQECALKSLSGIPMVGYRNYPPYRHITRGEFIRHSDGGVSERNNQRAHQCY